MSVHSFSSKRATDPVKEAKIHLAAAHRLAVFHDLEEGRLAARRQKQNEAWMWERIDAGLKSRFRTNAAVREQLPQLSRLVREGKTLASIAARRLLDALNR